MKQQGPELTYLTHRLADAPTEILYDPFIVQNPDKKIFDGFLNTLALFSDLNYQLGGDLLTYNTSSQIKISLKEIENNHIKIVQLICYILMDEWFHTKKEFLPDLELLLKDKNLVQLSKIVQVENFVYDPERREELVRLCLSMIGLRPKGESENQSQDRLQTLNSVERHRVIEETKKAKKRAQALREALAKKEAEEAASKMPRE